MEGKSNSGTWLSFCSTSMMAKKNPLRSCIMETENKHLENRMYAPKWAPSIRPQKIFKLIVAQREPYSKLSKMLVESWGQKILEHCREMKDKWTNSRKRMKQETRKVLGIPLPLLWNCKKLFYQVSFVMWFVMIYQRLFCSLTSRLTILSSFVVWKRKSLFKNLGWTWPFSLDRFIFLWQVTKTLYLK